jgi:succinyl-diaminopimelate desuccinylase
MMIKEALDRWVEGQQQGLIAEIKSLLAYESITGRTEENKACLEAFLALAREQGFATEMTREKDLGIVEMGEGPETLGILVHLDVVDVGDVTKWKHPPFQGTVEDGFLWGRGTVDDKGPAIMSLFAMKAVKELKLPFRRKVWLLVGTSEEVEWTDIGHFKQQFPLPDFGYSPDGEFPIFYAEKGYADVEILFPGDGKGDILKLECGDSNNTVPSKASIETRQGGSLVSQGHSVHSSTPQGGENALVKLCQCIKDHPLPDFARFVRDCFTDDSYGGALGIDDGSHEWKGELLGKTTAVPTRATLEKKGVLLVVNIRQRVGTTREQIEKAFQLLQDQYRFRFRITSYMDGMRVDQGEPFLKAMVSVHQQYDVPWEFLSAPGTSYAKAMERMVSWGPVFPEDPSCAHQENEKIRISSMLLATKMYARYIQQMTIFEGEEHEWTSTQR